MIVKTILMVCQGNICRSPMAEGFFAHQLSAQQSTIVVTSAGLGAVIGYPAEPHAQTVMLKHGIDISKHRARQLTENIFRQTDLIFVMTRSHLHLLTRQFLAAKGKTFLLGHWQNFEVPDPFKQPYEMFESVYQQMILAWQDWKIRIL